MTAGSHGSDLDGCQIAASHRFTWQARCPWEPRVAGARRTSERASDTNPFARVTKRDNVRDAAPRCGGALWCYIKTERGTIAYALLWHPEELNRGTGLRWGRGGEFIPAPDFFLFDEGSGQIAGLKLHNRSWSAVRVQAGTRLTAPLIEHMGAAAWMDTLKLSEHDLTLLRAAPPIGHGGGRQEPVSIPASAHLSTLSPAAVASVAAGAQASSRRPTESTHITSILLTPNRTRCRATRRRVPNLP